MNWSRSLENFEFVVIGVFLLLYLGFLVRYYFINKKIKANFKVLFFKLLLRSAFVALVILALLGPSFGEVKREVKAIGKDIFIAVDLSESMNAADIPPTRLQKMKNELKTLTNAFNSDRIGLIIFSSEAFMQCPLTFDQSALNLFLETLNTNLVNSGGTDFGPPLKMAYKKLLQSDSQKVSEKAKIIILISDGEDFGDETSSIAKDIEESGIQLFTLGIGTKKGGKIIVENGGYKKDREGNDVTTALNPDHLKKLAVRTDGKYFEINENSNDLSKMINAINQIEGELRETKKVDAISNKYYYFLLGALFILLLDLLISLKAVKI